MLAHCGCVQLQLGFEQGAVCRQIAVVTMCCCMGLRLLSECEAAQAWCGDSSATEAGYFGVQLWIALSLNAKHCECRPIGPRELFVVLLVDERLLIVGIGHPPSKAAMTQRVFTIPLVPTYEN